MADSAKMEDTEQVDTNLCAHHEQHDAAETTTELEDVAEHSDDGAIEEHQEDVEHGIEVHQAPAGIERVAPAVEKDVHAAEEMEDGEIEDDGEYTPVAKDPVAPVANAEEVPKFVTPLERYQRGYKGISFGPKSTQAPEILVKNFPATMTESDLRLYFGEFGTVTACSVADARVTFSDLAALNRVFAQPQHTLLDTAVLVVPVPPPSDADLERDDLAEYESTGVHLSNLLPTMTEHAVKSEMSVFGVVTHVHLVLQPKEGCEFGFGFVNYEDPTSAVLALAAGARHIDGAEVKINMTRKLSRPRDGRPNPRHTAHPYGGRGRGRGDFRTDGRGRGRGGRGGRGRGRGDSSGGRGRGDGFGGRGRGDGFGGRGDGFGGRGDGFGGRGRGDGFGGRGRGGRGGRGFGGRGDRDAPAPGDYRRAPQPFQPHPYPPPYQTPPYAPAGYTPYAPPVPAYAPPPTKHPGDPRLARQAPRDFPPQPYAPSYAHPPQPYASSYGAPRYDAPLPRYDAPPPHHDAPPLHYDAPPPRYDAPAPRYDAPAPRYDAPPPRYDAPPAYGASYAPAYPPYPPPAYGYEAPPRPPTSYPPY
ncbi:hypothetical protein ACHHYP_20431 [Achlya hypogyna]|uniref:RRM domain-containing protein n=1 Tax=Achlya hypogyna TaxID=1202772 RepID=A0A1V9YN44_ACHHY|nr:hypothetical protein ACHHYP_20431 [Achlya hypogyna]